MSTPNVVLERPGAPAPLALINSHGAALLLRGVTLRCAQLQRLHELDVMGDEAFSERHGPLVEVAEVVGRTLDDWAATHGRGRFAGDDSVEALWPDGPPLPEIALTMAQLWETRLAVDYVAIATIDEAPGELDLDALRVRNAPVLALYDAVLGSLRAAGFSDNDL